MNGIEGRSAAPQGAEVRKDRPRDCHRPVGAVRFVLFFRARRHETEVVDFEGLNCKLWATYHGRIISRDEVVSPDYDPIRRCNEQAEEYEVMFFEEERLGPAALEARGDRCMASGRRRQRWNFAISNDYEDAACAYILAENWRKAALAFSEQAVYEQQFGDERALNAASALLRSAKCYAQIEEKEDIQNSAAIAKLNLGIETPFGTCRDGELEEIIAIITTDASPSTIHDSPIHVVTAASGRRAPERKELSGGRNGEIPSGGEIDAIAIVIERDIISIIIIIISTIYTAITTAAPRISMNEVRKKLFTISLSGKAAHWYKLLKNGDSIDWEDIVPLFYSKFYPPSEIHKDRNRIYNFWPHDGESIAQAWGRLKSLMLKCPIHELPGNVIIDNFYARLSFQDKTLLDTSCSGSFTRKNEEFKRDLLDRIQENTEGWENDKDRESGIIYDYKCIEAFMDTDKFRNMSATYGLDSQVVANLYKAFASHYELPKKNFDKYHEPYKDKVDSSVNKCVVVETVDNVIPEAYIEKTPFPAKMKEYSVISSAVNKSEKKPKEPEEQIKIELAVAIVKDLVTENVEDGHIIFCEDASNIVSHPNKSKQVSVPMLSVRIGDHCYYGLCDIGASVSAIPYELYTEIMHEIGSCELEDIDVVIHRLIEKLFLQLVLFEMWKFYVVRLNILLTFCTMVSNNKDKEPLKENIQDPEKEDAREDEEVEEAPQERQQATVASIGVISREKEPEAEEWGNNSKSWDSPSDRLLNRVEHNSEMIRNLIYRIDELQELIEKLVRNSSPPSPKE
ncbi:hypothetical protein QYE76_011908 [Lolium multiflorum]|uniref:Retrotransposon gag domain-containing protein n=1 Tax=Lolium multiflorum TaxID=4521 RepID=A0AAD8TW90_LOLMU|nr:hypothetical protein QYE76_011908 [Lolium multiflorum]